MRSISSAMMLPPCAMVRFHRCYSRSMKIVEVGDEMLQPLYAVVLCRVVGSRRVFRLGSCEGQPMALPPRVVRIYGTHGILTTLSMPCQSEKKSR